MKKPSIFQSSQSMARRLTLRVTTTNFLVYLALLVLIVVLIYLGGYMLGMLAMSGITKYSNEKTDNVLSSVEVAISNTVPEIEESLDDPEKMYLIAERMLRLNPNIVGSAVAFEPNYYKEKGVQFSPFAYRKDSVIHTKQLGTAEYEYHYMDWYQIPKLLGKPYWSEPYFDAGGGDMPIITYSQPLLDSNGNIYAVFTADLSLDWIEDIASFFIGNFSDGLSDYFYNFIIGRGGTYIMHPNKERVLNETIFSMCFETKATDDDHVAYAMIGGNNGMGMFKQNGASYHVYYSPIQRTGWSMGMVISDKLLFYSIGLLCLPVILLMIVGIIVVYFISRHIIRRVTKPLTLFTNSVDEIAQGHFNNPLPEITTRDEMLRLRNSFATMQASLVRQIEETKSVNEQKGRMESELMIARDIQMSMLPKIYPPFPNRSDVDIYGTLTPAKEVGGDLYDFYIRDEKLFFCIGDVSGKGVPASLVMAVTRSLFRNISMYAAEPGAIVTSLNKALTTNNDSDMFVTLFVGVLDLPTGRLRYCNAGHDAPLLIGDVGIGLLPVESNLPVGIVSEWRYKQQDTVINPQTTIFLYTDGLTEAENVRHELFKEKRILKTAQQSTRQPKELISQMMATVKTFVGEAEQSDDLTMLAIQYTKQQHAVTMQRSITLDNNIEDVPQLAAFVDEVCETVGFDMSVAMSLNLAMEEAVVNVMDYAYPAGTKGKVCIEAEADDQQLSFIISDWGKPFDPTAKAEVDTTLSAEDRPIGGLGIHLVRQIMDSINYERMDGKNVLTLRKKLV
jgi:sigma-B regulation protein RsbU (phosphoserine phosphatase)